MAFSLLEKFWCRPGDMGNTGLELSGCSKPLDGHGWEMVGPGLGGEDSGVGKMISERSPMKVMKVSGDGVGGGRKGSNDSIQDCEQGGLKKEGGDKGFSGVQKPMGPAQGPRSRVDLVCIYLLLLCGPNLTTSFLQFSSIVLHGKFKLNFVDATEIQSRIPLLAAITKV